jgi:glycosyltransferase involved in cell wall biosynthesis
LRVPMRQHPNRIRILLIRPPVWIGPPRKRLAALAKSFLIGASMAIAGARRIDFRAYYLTDAFGVTKQRYLLPRPTVIDPVVVRERETRNSARKAIGMDMQTLVVGIIGAVDERKNPTLALHAVLSLQNAIPNRLLLAGQISPQLRAETRTELSHQSVTIAGGYLDEAALSRHAAACDIILAMYENHDSPSGILALAAQQGVPVIVPCGGLLEDVVMSLGIGATATFDPGDIARAITETLEQRPQFADALEVAARRLTIASFSNALAP